MAETNMDKFPVEQPKVLYGDETPEEALAAETLRHRITHPNSTRGVFKLEQREPIRPDAQSVEDLGSTAVAAQRIIGR